MANDQVQTVSGPLPVAAMGKTLVHEHVLVDFIGAGQINDQRWDRSTVIKKVLPYIRAAKQLGINTMFDCTPAYLGRDPLLLKALADSTGMNFLTNTGLYGAVNNKYLPAYAFTETARQLADRWIREAEAGIDGTGIRPGFIKIGVGDSLLTPLHRKLVEAAAMTHLRTGLTICSHTGPAIAAFDEIKVLQHMGVDPAAFVWVHAQAEKDLGALVKAAKSGAWISLDGIGWGDVSEYLPKISALKDAGLLRKVLISHDAGWYKPGEYDGGDFNGFTNISQQLFPALLSKGYTQKDLDTLLIINPARAFLPQIKKLK
ncbi:phosphotriesterase family protein [Flavihumibacter fluvii]|uniref:phosphotriesterase family protein n=1 Tax=Flavihumibacter fluvii TaxID=2838157 RepID=UPI001BDE2721|nr:hypothetical protein [Flavihumibacter fluvii]ULQ52681.1 hypothetical protein KJS93_21570 [Flavihumibacter fluvii]